MWDIIGDVHGYADALEHLLLKMGYRRENDVFTHPNRRVIFCGDLIDRGPQIRECLNIVRAMTEAGSASVVMGNHEFNALCFHNNDPESGNPLRAHTEKNIRQHRATLEQLSDSEMADALLWFARMPIRIETDELRVVHACWDPSSFSVIDSRGVGPEGLSVRFLAEAVTEGSPLFRATETTLKGPTAMLPDGCVIPDREGHPRRRARLRWFDADPGVTWPEASFPANADLPRIPALVADQIPGYPTDACPVFFGHYWLPAASPQPQRPNVACLDYSAAAGGFLCAYRYQGEGELTADNFVTVSTG